MINEQVPLAYAKRKHFECDLFSVIDGRHSIVRRHGNCENPVELVSWGSREYDLPGPNDLITQVTTVRCRKCKGCRRYRTAQVVAACEDMANRASRTKFVTLTVDDRWKQKSEDFFVLEMQRYIKRVRALGPKFMYAWVVEYQQRGAPHAHILIFELDNPVSNSMLKGRYLKGTGRWKPRWPWGFMDVKVAENATNASWYLIKYLLKDPATRFRRSIGHKKRIPPQGGVLLKNTKRTMTTPLSRTANTTDSHQLSLSIL